MSSFFQSLAYFFRLPFSLQWRTALVQLPRYVPLSILHITSPKGPHPFIIALPGRKDNAIPIYVFVPPRPVDSGAGTKDDGADTTSDASEWKVPVVLDFHGGGFIMGSPLEQAPYAAMMSRELGAVVISVSYRIGPFSQFPAAIHDAEDVLSAILDDQGGSKAGRVLKEEIQRYYSFMREDALRKKSGRHDDEHLDTLTTITLDPSRLVISGFSAGGNIALNMAMSVPPCVGQFSIGSPRRLSLVSPRRSIDRTCANPTPLNNLPTAPQDTFSPCLPPIREPTKLDDPEQPWPSLLPPVEAQPRLLPLLLFYPSLDARLLPHERPLKTLPNALNPEDRGAQKPRMPGLFSIMGPSYLPRRLRAHPRASPGLVDPENIARNAAIFLVLPEKDTLAVQSDIWVDWMNGRGWKGPVRFGDGREGDWDGHFKAKPSPNGSASGSTTVTESDEQSKLSNQDPEKENGGLEIWHAPNCRHGWTQFPVQILGKHEKKERELVFDRTLDFVKANWKKSIPVKERGNRIQILRKLSIPTPFGLDS
ncbi:alpha/beta-hydrolase [Aaosphaeria arxii CBS 175.79]|uniref:Alpha/beta-hydrolase n=1 Tax=Aaosphaeria arxii CBS 175.79 TaxID=1450172 RepID=A0A6A5Y8N5_9PLEO|nr:alpha/beta-hydrolase [Aaosphaeria arxii CBS 175.79]KAF2021935.1 alpha/beta-hydrolase [Aaosphaeria arxii CBS 175.79]